MIQNKNNIQLTSLEENAVKSLHSVIATILGEKAFTILIEITEGAFCEKYLELDLPLRPEDGEKISPIYIIMKKSGVFFLEYFQNVECGSYERGCIASNTITDSIKELPIKCIFYENQQGFYLSSVFHFPDSIITLLILSFLLSNILLYSSHIWTEPQMIKKRRKHLMQLQQAVVMSIILVLKILIL